MKKIIELINFYRESFFTLCKFPISLVFILIGIILLIISVIKGKGAPVNLFLFIIQLVGWGFIFIIFIIEILTKEDYKSHLGRVIGVSLAWFVSAVIFVNYKDEDIFIFICKLYTSWEYILIGCILYDFMSLVSPKSQKDKTIEDKLLNDKDIEEKSGNK